MTDQLKPCPFCGDNNAWDEEEECGDFIEYQVFCHCGASGPIYRDYDEAIKAWNTRLEQNK